VSTAKVTIDGLDEFQEALKRAGTGTAKMRRDALNVVAGVVIDYARPRMPKRSGRAASSLKAKSSDQAARITMGGARAPYAPWLEFGGEGKRRGRPPRREFIREGRYVYRALSVRRTEIDKIMMDGLAELARGAGLEVT
jgi:HK97 gp10 family phage protein